MNVADLAKDLGLPPSAVLERCALLSIEAAWAGADLLPHDEVTLRDAFAAEAPTPLLDVAEPSRAAAPAHADERPDPEEAVLIDAAAVPAGGEADAETEGDAGGAPTTDGPEGPPEAPRRAPAGFYATATVGEATALGRRQTSPRAGATPQARRLDPAVRPALAALALALVTAIGADQLSSAAWVLPCWIFLAIMLVVVLVSANRARYRITTHPELRSGLAIAIAALVAGTLGVVALGGAVWTVVRSAPASQAPARLGDLRSVQEMRWGYQRVRLISSNDWERPAKDVDTCWEQAGEGEDAGHEQRVEVGGRATSCESLHQYEVIQVVAADRDADSPYPGPERLKAIGRERCAERVATHATKASRLHVEYPTHRGWDDGDHDLACVVEAARSRPLDG